MWLLQKYKRLNKWHVAILISYNIYISFKLYYIGFSAVKGCTQIIQKKPSRAEVPNMFALAY
jgi:hypothetical protein